MSGRWGSSEELERALGGGHLVAVRVHHHRLLYSKPGRLPHRVTPRHADRVARRTQQAVQDTVRATGQVSDQDLLQPHVTD